MQLQPGVSSGKEGSSELNIRGGSSDQTLILMDDIPIYNHAHAFGFVSVFIGDYIKSAELYKGYAPANYGGRLSGVATMNINEGNRNRHQQSLQIGTTTASAVFEGPITKGKGSYFVGGRYFIPDLFLRLGSAFLKDASMIPVFGFYDITAKLSYDLDSRNTMYLSFYTGHDALKLTFNDSGISADTEYRTRSKAGVSWGNMVGSVRLSSKLTNRIFLNTTLYYSHLSNSKISDYKEFIEPKTVLSDVRSKMGELGLKANMQHNINSWYDDLSYGVNLAYQSLTPQNLIMDRDGVASHTKYGERNLVTATAFVENKFQFRKLELSAGLRFSLYNNNSESKAVLEPRAALTYRMNKGSLWLGYAENSQPLFSMKQQLYSLPVDYWIPFQSADELPRSRQISLGYKHNTDFGMEFFSEVYLKKSRNVAVVYNVSDFLIEEGGYYLASGNAYGAEFMIQYEYRKFNAALSYVYSKSQYELNGRKVDFMYDTPHDLNLFASYETLRKGKRVHTLSMNLHYNTGLPYIISNEAYYQMDQPNGYWDTQLVNNPLYSNIRLRDFFRIDMNYAMEKQLRKGSRVWKLSLLNATAYINPYVVFPKNNGYKALCLIPFLPSFSYVRKLQLKCQMRLT